MDSVTVIAAGLSILFFTLFLFRNRPSVESTDKPARVLAKRARRAERKGNFLESGDLYAGARMFKEAAQAYVKIGEFQKAADACMEFNDHRNAAECFYRLEKMDRAAELFMKAKDYIRAAETYASIGLPQEAAPLFEKGGQPVQAAEAFAQIGFYRKAGELMAESEDHTNAASFLMRALQERISRRDASVKEADDRVTMNLAALTSVSLIQSGQREKAAQVLETGRHYRQAASLYEELGMGKKASELFMEARDAESAARILESSDIPDEGGLDIAEALYREGKKTEAVDLLQRLGEWDRAAQIHIENGDVESAVKAYKNAGDDRSAANLLVEMDQPADAAALLLSSGLAEEAAQIFRKIGETEREAEALLEAGAFLQAARSLTKLGLEKEATEALQKIERNHTDFKEANRLLGDLFYGQKMWSLAISGYQNSLGEENVRRDNLDSFYRYTASLKEDGQLQGAVSILEKILLVDYHYRDVKDQLQSMKAVLAASTPGGTPSQPPFIAGQGSPDTTMPAGADRAADEPGRYEIIEEIGRGGMGVVYKAQDNLLDRTVAYKVLPPQVQRNQRVLDLFLREAKSAAKLSHPNIVTIYDADKDRGEYIIIMEYVEGNSLKELLEDQGVFKIKPALVLIGQVMRALSYAHGRGIVHRDIKPANLLWSKNEKLVKITDFGLARALEEGRKTHTQMAGTPYYMSPEQILGGLVDHRADLYSVGVTLYEFLTGTVPFKEGDVLYHHVHSAPESPDKHNPEIPEQLSRFILRCLEKNVEKRFASVDTALNEMKGILKK